MANSIGCTVENSLFLKENKRFFSEGLQYLEKNFFSYHGEGSASHEGIQVVAAPNRFTEMEYAAQQVIRQVREKKYRFREIAVVTNALGEYEKSLKSIFREYEIPFFLDVKKEIVSHPLIELVLSSLDAITYHFSYESMFRYLKTGLAPLTREEVDILENYVLAYGIKGYKWELPQWTMGFLGEMDTKQEEMNTLRQKAIEPLLDFGKGLDREGKYTVLFLTERVLQLMNRLKVSEILQQWATQKQSVDAEKSMQHQQIWNIFMDILTHMTELLGQEEVTIEDFAKILEAGVSKSDMGIIPTTTDSVLIGDIERSRLPEIKVLFLLGVNEGVLPSPAVAQGIFTDMEREVLEKSGVELAAGGKRRAFEEQFLIYRGMTKPSHLLCLSYCTGDLEGKLWRPSSLIQKIHMLFPNLKEISADKCNTTMENVTTQQGCFHKLGQKMRDYAQNGTMESVWKDIYSFYYLHPQWQERLQMLTEGISVDVSEEMLSLQVRKKLYGKELHTSVSKLERFAACPYAYFAEYGLQAKQRKEFTLQTPDLGILFHGVLERFFTEVSNKKISWEELTSEWIQECIEEILSDSVETLGNGVLKETAANRYLIQRLKRISNRAINTLAEHIRSGDFIPYDYEIGFGEKQKLPPVVIPLEDGGNLILRGKIDRVDILEREKHRYVKIIDYKSGEKEVSFRDIYHGLQLQLFVYLDAFLEYDASSKQYKTKPGGAFYFHIKDPMITVDKDTNE
ncbi:MAG: ATP-dependent helicase/deoxyribonuclease subunit B, partial [Epulopiscium sp.]|nr:ATP-dependent helicase/deoxyribonuclease subunit B [Candidatus Epulonipiscium sp.]